VRASPLCWSRGGPLAVRVGLHHLIWPLSLALPCPGTAVVVVRPPDDMLHPSNFLGRTTLGKKLKATGLTLEYPTDSINEFKQELANGPTGKIVISGLSQLHGVLEEKGIIKKKQSPKGRPLGPPSPPGRAVPPSAPPKREDSEGGNEGDDA
jgi:hypothetical protein